MSPKKAHKHSRITSGCSSCKAIQKKWYAKLKADGFIDIEYGLDNPRFTLGNVDPGQPSAEAKRTFYDLVWQVFHAWVSAGRSKRDCRVVELFAMQDGDTGTVRGISRTLKCEKLRPWSTGRVQHTLLEIKTAALDANGKCSIIPIYYENNHHKAA